MRLPSPTTARVGVALFALGVIFVLIDVLPYFAGDSERPLWLNLLCLLAPLGLGVALVGVWRDTRTRQREALHEVSGQRHMAH